MPYIFDCYKMLKYSNLEKTIFCLFIAWFLLTYTMRKCGCVKMKAIC